MNTRIHHIHHISIIYACLEIPPKPGQLIIYSSSKRCAFIPSWSELGYANLLFQSVFCVVFLQIGFRWISTTWSDFWALLEIILSQPQILGFPTKPQALQNRLNLKSCNFFPWSFLKMFFVEAIFCQQYFLLKIYSVDNFFSKFILFQIFWVKMFFMLKIYFVENVSCLKSFLSENIFCWKYILDLSFPRHECKWP